MVFLPLSDNDLSNMCQDILGTCLYQRCKKPPARCARSSWPFFFLPLSRSDPRRTCQVVLARLVYYPCTLQVTSVLVPSPESPLLPFLFPYVGGIGVAERPAVRGCEGCGEASIRAGARPCSRRETRRASRGARRRRPGLWCVSCFTGGERKPGFCRGCWNTDGRVVCHRCRTPVRHFGG